MMGADTGFMPDLIAFAILAGGAGPCGRYRSVALGRDGRRLPHGQAVRCRAARLRIRELSGLRRLGAQARWVRGFAMVTKKHGIIIETPTEARQAERGPSVLILLMVSLILVAIGMAAVWYIFFRT
jgi:hypothetical protein